ncbi:MAG: hypothetical protein IJ153_03240 [Clostridia bacterium]|nr:hypothetical protein [Clostridia bacterium]
MAIKDWAKRKNRELQRKALEDRDTRSWQGGAYHRYFEGYTETKRTDERGKTRILRVYTGTVYRQDLPRKNRIWLRICYLILFFIMAGCVALAAYGQGGAGRALYVALPEVATLCLLAWMLYTLAVNYLFLPERMTVNDYRVSSLALRRYGKWLAVAFGLDFLATVIDYFLSPANAGLYRSLWMTLGAFTLGAALAMLMVRMETNLPYTQEESGEKAPEDGVPIENERSEGIFRRGK